MSRFAIVVGLVLIVLVTNGCPRKIVDDTQRDTRTQGRSSGQIPSDDEPSALDAAVNDSGDDGESRDDAVGDDVADVSDDVAEVDVAIEGEVLEDDADEGGDDEDVVDDSAVDELAATDDEPEITDAVIDEPVAEVDTDIDESGVVEESVVDEKPLEEPKFTPQPPTVKLSREAKRFAGSWQAVVYDFNGESESATGERIVNLDESGAFEGTALNEAGRLETGIWSMEDNTITLSFGPAGDVKYTVDQPSDNIAIWHGSNGGAMFCIRLPMNDMAMSPDENYESGFGPLTFSRSGPGYWKGTYGDPEGNLVLQNEGSFLFGTWEQGKQAGFAIFEFSQTGFEGFWWYSGQSCFGGEWNGEMQ